MTQLQKFWKKYVGILAGIYITRMFGMFLIFPVFSLYALGLSDATPSLIGIALGVYGLTQGVLQLPFGYLSDHIGRKKMLLLGLFIFLIGTIVAALAENIYTMILGRAIQGMGAISSVALALATDITPVEKRSKVMAIIGGSIGIAFVISLILGPLIASIPGFGLKGIFWIIFALIFVAMITSLWLPELKREDVIQTEYQKNKLWKACVAVFLLHGIFTGTFVVLPKMLSNTGIDNLHQWWIYLPANIIAILFMRYKTSPHPLNFSISFLVIGIAYAIFIMDGNLWILGIATTIFFIGFYRLETGLPHWVANVIGSESRGKAMGVYSTAQFLGSFIGAAFIGFLWNYFSILTAIATLMIIALLSCGILLYWGKQDTLYESLNK